MDPKPGVVTEWPAVVSVVVLDDEKWDGCRVVPCLVGTGLAIPQYLSQWRRWHEAAVRDPRASRCSGSIMRGPVTPEVPPSP